MRHTVIFISGPTASGKSNVANILSKKINGELISCDSMQVYRGMDIGTAKPSSKDREAVQHHLIDILPTSKEHTVFDHREMALKAIKDILSRKKTPIVVGGSGLYIKAIVDGLAEQPGKQPIRSSLELKSNSELERLIQKLDPEKSKILHLNDRKRMIRALEIVMSSKILQAEWEKKAVSLNDLGLSFAIFGLRRNREELYQRIENRVENMFESGWMDEVKKLSNKKLSNTAQYAIGYKEILEYFRGEKSLDQIKEEIKKRTRHFAKRQMTWFRKENRIHWIPVSGNSYAQIVNKILQKLKKMETINAER